MLRLVPVPVDETVIVNQTPVRRYREWTTLQTVRRPSKGAVDGHRSDAVPPLSSTSVVPDAVADVVAVVTHEGRPPTSSPPCSDRCRTLSSRETPLPDSESTMIIDVATNNKD